MELDKIEHLLAKYLEAETTLAEEEVLKKYFTQDKVAPHLEQYASMFTYFTDAKKEQFTKPVLLKTKKSNFNWQAIAATAVLLFGIYFGITKYNSTNSLSEQEMIAAKTAEKELKKALVLIGDNFTRGTEKIGYLNEFEETKQKIFIK